MKRVNVTCHPVSPTTGSSANYQLATNRGHTDDERFG